MFLNVSRKRPACSRITFSSKRLGTHTLLDATRNSRTASTPYRSITTHGSTTFPRLFDIFSPSASSIWSLTTTAWYGGRGRVPAEGGRVEAGRGDSDCGCVV